MNRPMKFKHLLIANLVTTIVVASLFLSYQVIAVPKTSTAMASLSMEMLSYQGTLVDSNGNPVDGDQDITFRIYNDPSGPAYLWEESHIGINAVPVQNGLFNVMLGSLNPLPQSIWEETELFLGIQVGSDSEMTPREPIVITPLSQYAIVAKSVLPNSITGENIIEGAITQVQAPTLLQSANGENEIIRSGNGVYSDIDKDGRIEISYPCFPNGVRSFIAQNGHYNANHSEIIGNNGVGRCSTTVIISPPNSDPIRLNWIAIGN